MSLANGPSVPFAGGVFTFVAAGAANRIAKSNDENLDADARLDDRPKYHAHAPYRDPAWGRDHVRLRDPR